MATIVHLVRHGEVHNPQKILYGRLPGYRLSTRGQKMADVTSDELAGHDVTLLVASPLQRAQETAAPFAQKLGLDIVTDERVLEAGNDLEGLHIKGPRSALWNPKRWPMLANPAKPSWGEPYTEIRDRMWEAIDTARVTALGHEAVIVSHQLPIVMIQRDAQGLPLAHNPAARQCNLASVTSLVFDGSDLTDIFYAEPAQDV
ncbi:histidine phosphatase family protein [Corynebacterium sp. 320]|uniref:Histidine phosphatase family protein n=1 Tax=Corynebacterium zhongnanshanii TaxID=2768834 RepID=A0ABQ6VE74_9CORY|nr:MULTISPECIES: histidine phosphatase family protein [Corynebacterium]KAB1504408.1 histidine phosphatase family protein [Corynebacterium sp. 320]KAB1552493.1 histidine phosphatase family protein [Corynebacterium sp. 321]KAB1554292.1 histidine phosphatase family protein [Corynebacterium sp. 319]KAB3522735.1 histidine phosphatase family protein [Corynebacterium zhongnanshanii]KAB3528544.1 histidine phosphatase family protein [Corynebacterium sp. 250]